MSLKVGDKVIVNSIAYPWLKLGVVYGFNKVDISRVLIRVIGVFGDGLDGHAGAGHIIVDEEHNTLPDLPSGTKGYWWVRADKLKFVGSTL